MRPSPSCLVRIISRKALQINERQLIPQPKSQTQELQKPSFIDTLIRQRQMAGASWPQNIRLEPVVKKEVLAPVHADFRSRLKKLLKET